MNKEIYQTTAISIGDLKNGMLYFDNIIPTDFWVEFVEGIKQENFESLFQKVYDDIIPENLRKNRKFNETLFALNDAGYESASKFLVEKFKFSDEEYVNLQNIYAEKYFNFINEYQLGELPLVAVNNTKASASLKVNENNYDNPLLTLSNLNIISTSNTSWEQILEFRKDKDAKMKLRKLRLFAYENYSNKSKNYIEDDINTKIYEYELTAKKFGLQLIQGALNNVINSKLFTGFSTGSILTTVFAEHPAGLITVSTGAIVNLGQLTLEYNKQKIELQSLVKDNPASFITYYKDNYENRK